MSIDSTLKRKGRLVRSRNVLSREERINRLKLEERFEDGTNSPLGLPKVKIIKTVVGKKKKKEKKEEEEGKGGKKKK